MPDDPSFALIEDFADGWWHSLGSRLPPGLLATRLPEETSALLRLSPAAQLESPGFSAARIVFTIS